MFSGLMSGQSPSVTSDSGPELSLGGTDQLPGLQGPIPFRALRNEVYNDGVLETRNPRIGGGAQAPHTRHPDSTIQSLSNERPHLASVRGSWHLKLIWL
jgi:hypothetical protein